MHFITDAEHRLSAAHTTLHYFSSVLLLPFCSCSFANSTSSFKSTFSYPTENNFPFPNCCRLSQICCSLPQVPSCSSLNVALDVLLSWHIADAFSALLNGSSAMKASCFHTRISFRWPTSPYFPLDGEKSFPFLFIWWAVSLSGILSTFNAQLPKLNIMCFILIFCFSCSFHHKRLGSPALHNFAILPVSCFLQATLVNCK